MTDDTPAPVLTLPVASKSDKAFLRSITLKEELVSVPEWGRAVLVREMTAEENREYQLSNVKFDRGGNPQGLKKQDVDLRLVLRTCWDASNGTAIRLFTEDDLPLLRKQPASAIQRVIRVARRISGLSDDADPETRDETEKND